MSQEQERRQPSPGDVLVTTEAGVHLVSVVPHPHRLSFKKLSEAIGIARKWADANRGEVWHRVNGKTLTVQMDKRSSA